MPKIVHVCIPHTHRDYFSYSTEQIPAIGARVWVSLRQATKLGIVVAYETSDKYPDHPIKPLTEIIDQGPLLPPSLLSLCTWVSRYYQSPLSEVLPLVLPKQYRLGKRAELSKIINYQLTMEVEKAQQLIPKRAHKQLALINFLHEQKPFSKKQLRQAGFTALQIQPLLHLGILAQTEAIAALNTAEQGYELPLILNEEQNLAVATISQHLNEYHCFLLQGVTGSGKTEVYLQVIAQVLARQQQVLILVPEIGLTPQLLARFQARFKVPIAIIHSNLNEKERQQAWHLAHSNLAGLIIGTRTAIFTPLPKLGLIIIDEEHDASLKQLEGVRYSARDTALMRAHLAKIPIILGSATPSLESLYNCQLNKYSRLRLNQKALSTQPLHFQITDLRSLTLQHGLATSTLNTIANHLQRQNQVLVFINRRGYSPILLCHHCGWRANCSACDSHLTFHRQTNVLICHHCGLSRKAFTHCQACHSQELIPLGAGTQRIEDYLQTQFPTIQLLRIDRDEIRKKNELDACLAKINNNEVQLIVGTQMLAKGHHFPKLTLVVVVDADYGFYTQDFRALEQLGQLLVQVSGRAGRAQHPGQVIIQTHLPHHPLLNVLIQEGYDHFATALLATRQEASLPPYYYLAVIRAQNKKMPLLLDFLHQLKVYLSTHSVEVFGPAPAPLARKANQYRMQLLLKSRSRQQLQVTLTSLREWLATHKLASKVRWNIDVDPFDLS